MLTLPKNTTLLSAYTIHYKQTHNCSNINGALVKHSMRIHNFHNWCALTKTLTIHKTDCCCSETVQKSWRGCTWTGDVCVYSHNIETDHLLFRVQLVKGFIFGMRVLLNTSGKPNTCQTTVLHISEDMYFTRRYCPLTRALGCTDSDSSSPEKRNGAFSRMRMGR
jgi:hypothetical protein